jgi:hypothetical protein
MVDEDYGNLKSKVFFIWGATCTACVFFAYFLVPETKGLSLEQVDRMLEETTPRTSSKWIPLHMRGDHADVSSLDMTEKTDGRAPPEHHEHQPV